MQIILIRKWKSPMIYDADLAYLKAIEFSQNIGSLQFEFLGSGAFYAVKMIQRSSKAFASYDNGQTQLIFSTSSY